MQENVYISNDTKPHTVHAMGGGGRGGPGQFGKANATKERRNQSGIW